MKQFNDAEGSVHVRLRWKDPTPFFLQNVVQHSIQQPRIQLRASGEQREPLPRRSDPQHIFLVVSTDWWSPWTLNSIFKCLVSEPISPYYLHPRFRYSSFRSAKRSPSRRHGAIPGRYSSVQRARGGEASPRLLRSPFTPAFTFGFRAPGERDDVSALRPRSSTSCISAT